VNISFVHEDFLEHHSLSDSSVSKVTGYGLDDGQGQKPFA
jgi:hypothetical protein